MGALAVIAVTAPGLRGLVVGDAGTGPAGWWRTPLAVAGYGLTVLALMTAIPRRYGLDRVQGLSERAPADVLRCGILGVHPPTGPALMPRVFNFSAGPATLPEAVLEQARDELLDWRGVGASIVELSHRGAEFMGVAAEAEADLT